MTNSPPQRASLRAPVKGRPAILKRHSRKCRVCRHPRRQAIERLFLGWCSPETIARKYPPLSASMIYRHVHATGLYLRRFAPLREGLDRILEHSQDALATADMIIRAARAYSRLPDESIAGNPAAQPENPNREPIANRT
jgi:hypothetical protein